MAQKSCSQSKQEFVDAISQTGHRGNEIASDSESDNDREASVLEEALLVVGEKALVIAGAKVLIARAEALMVASAKALMIVGAKVLIDGARVGRPPKGAMVENSACG